MPPHSHFTERETEAQRGKVTRLSVHHTLHYIIAFSSHSSQSESNTLPQGSETSHPEEMFVHLRNIGGHVSAPPVRTRGHCPNQ